MRNLKMFISHKYNHKIMAFCCALIWWHIAHQIYPDTIWIDVPLYNYNQQPDQDITYPSHVKVLLQMDRMKLYMQNFEEYSAHVDNAISKDFQEPIYIKKDHIVVPYGIKVVDYYPKIISFYKNK